jgi:hypothetical protein
VAFRPLERLLSRQSALHVHARLGPLGRRDVREGSTADAEGQTEEALKLGDLGFG